MIRQEKSNKALYALHQIFVCGRFMAYKEESFKDIAILLDYAEIMPGYIDSSVDKTDEFVICLEGIVESFPQLTHILDEFNADSLLPKWYHQSE